MKHGMMLREQGVFVTSEGEPIQVGCQVILHCNGKPIAEQFTLVNGVMEDGDDGEQHPLLTLKTANGAIQSYKKAERFTPCGMNYDLYHTVYLDNPDTAMAETIKDITKG